MFGSDFIISFQVNEKILNNYLSLYIYAASLCLL